MVIVAQPLAPTAAVPAGAPLNVSVTVELGRNPQTSTVIVPPVTTIPALIKPVVGPPEGVMVVVEPGDTVVVVPATVVVVVPATVVVVVPATVVVVVPATVVDVVELDVVVVAQELAG